MGVEKGNTVKVHYVGTLDDGTEFDNSKKRGEPLEFKAGEGNVIAGFDDAIIGMEKGESKKVEIPPEKAYGEPSDDAVKKIPKDKFPDTPEVGMMVAMQLPNGQKFPGKVLEVGENDVTVDLNHPLAGKKLNFEIEVVEA